MASKESSLPRRRSSAGPHVIRPSGRLSETELRLCADAVARALLIAFPTDTVYGIGADAGNPEAIRELFRAKQRSCDKPLPVLVGRRSDLDRFGRDVPPEARALAEVFWPGPLTIVVRCSGGICPEAISGGDTVGLRMPNHPLALQLIRYIDRPMAVTSANLSGLDTPPTAAEVLQMLGHSLSVLIESEDVGSGVPSTVVDLTTPPFRILRLGAVTKKQLNDVLRRQACATANSLSD